MSLGKSSHGLRRQAWESGFSLLEVLVSTAILLIVAAVVTSGMVSVSKTEGSVSNRTQMHAGVRSATELMQQEIGQAGRIALPDATASCTGGPSTATPVVLCSAVAASTPNTASVVVNSTAGMFVGENLMVDTGANQETVALTQVTPGSNTIQAVFNNSHATGAPLTVAGGFGTGIVPDTGHGMANGSTGYVLKLYGDINSDGNMMYVEYTCDTPYAAANGLAPSTGAGNLYRNTMPFTAAIKPAVDSTMVLLSSVEDSTDSGGNELPCFQYQVKPVGCSGSSCMVVDVAVTITVQTQEPDPQTGLYQKETKALLNVSPRNIFNVWELAGASINNRTQPMPASVVSLLP